MERYQKSDFCKTQMECVKALEEGTIDFDCTQCKAYKFHEYLQERNQIIDETFQFEPLWNLMINEGVIEFVELEGVGEETVEIN